MSTYYRICLLGVTSKLHGNEQSSQQVAKYSASEQQSALYRTSHYHDAHYKDAFAPLQQKDIRGLMNELWEETSLSSRGPSSPKPIPSKFIPSSAIASAKPMLPIRLYSRRASHHHPTETEPPSHPHRKILFSPLDDRSGEEIERG